MENLATIDLPSNHPKGEKILMDIRYGDPIPPGIILGKDRLIFIKDYNLKD